MDFSQSKNVRSAALGNVSGIGDRRRQPDEKDEHLGAPIDVESPLLYCITIASIGFV